MNEGQNVISLDAAKNVLAVDFSDDDEQIALLIDTAVSMVEKYTDHMLYWREKTWNATSREVCISSYPIRDISATYNDEPTVFGIRYGSLTTYVSCQCGSIISATVGYEDISQIPSPLISACYKIITYLYQNKDNYTATLPTDVQILLNQWRRSATI